MRSNQLSPTLLLYIQIKAPDRIDLPLYLTSFIRNVDGSENGKKMNKQQNNIKMLNRSNISIIILYYTYQKYFNLIIF